MGTRKKWIDKMTDVVIKATRTVHLRRFYGLWDEPMREEIVALGAARIGWKDVRREVTRVTIDNVIQLHKAVRHMLLPKTDGGRNEESEREEKRETESEEDEEE